MSETERIAQYHVCQKRGHMAGDEVRASNPPWSVCVYCGTLFRHELMLIESNAPVDKSNKKTDGSNDV